MKKWKCTVCGYIHTGLEPPDVCPVCGADRSMFVEVVEEEEKAPLSIEKVPAPEAVAEPEIAEPETGEQAASAGIYTRITDHLTVLHAHPISVHIPNGVLPVSVLFLIVAILTDCASLSQAAFYNLVFVVLSMPAVLFTGFNDWQKRFGGIITPVFRKKIICGAVVLVFAAVLVIWRLIDPEVTSRASYSRWLYIYAHLIMLAAAAVAGYFGGKLVIFQGNFTPAKASKEKIV